MSDKKTKIYLSFKNKETAEKWLQDRGIKAQFDKSQVINVYVKDNKDECRKICKD